MPKPTKEATNGTYAEQVAASLLGAFEINNRINLYLIENLPAAAWSAKMPDGKGRSVAAIIAHMHNVRLMWLKACGAEKLLDPLDGANVTPTQAERALKESCAALSDIIGKALATDGRIKGFKPDAGAFLSYLIAHDAHHRGQITMLARQNGHPVPKQAMFGMWEWGVR